MAEESPQSSSKPQETSKDSGVITEGQLSNTTGENALAQSNQNSQALTAQNNQNNKKYDLGVLFVHGIGDQQEGDTFKAMYEPIKKELEENKEILFVELSKTITGARCPVVEKGHLKKNKRADVIFRESHWNNLNGKVNLKNYISNAHSLCGFAVSLLIGSLKALNYLLISLLAACVSHIKSLTVFISLFVIISYIYKGKFSQDGVDVLIGVAITLIVLLTIISLYVLYKKWFRDKKESRDFFLILIKIPRKIMDIFIVLCDIKFWAYLFIKIWNIAILLVWLYMQIDEISNGKTNRNNPVIIVRNDIQKLINSCNAVIVVAHSMGAYLSVAAIHYMQNLGRDKINLITFGSGFAPVSLLRDLNGSCCRKIGFYVKNLLILFTLTGSIYSFIFFAVLMHQGASLGKYYGFLTLFYVVTFYALHKNSINELSKSQAVDIGDNIVWQNHSFTSDLVGNSVSHLHSGGRSRLIPAYNPFAHSIKSYFLSWPIMRKVVSGSILDLLNLNLGSKNVSKYPANYKIFIIIYIFFAIAMYSGMFFGKLGISPQSLLYFLLFSPFLLASMIFFRQFNNYIYDYSPYIYWDIKAGVKINSYTLYICSFIFGSCAGMTGFFFLDFVSLLTLTN